MECGLDPSGRGQGQVMGSSEHENKPATSVTCGMLTELHVELDFSRITTSRVISQLRQQAKVPDTKLPNITVGEYRYCDPQSRF
jgi:hypothetical protein